MSDDAFESARLLLSAAQEQFDEFVATEKSFANDPQTGVLFREFDQKTGNKFVKMRLGKPIPKSLRLNIYRIVTDLRNALDQALFAAWTVITGAEPEEDVYFPIGGSESDFRAKVRRRVPSDLWDLFYSFEAYPSGKESLTDKDLLFALSRISGPNKHRIAIGVGINPNAMHIKKATGEKVFIHVPRWDRRKNEATLFTIFPGGNINYDLYIPIFIAFAKVRTVDGQPVGFFAKSWIRRVSEVVEAIAEAATQRAGNPASH